MTKEEILKMEAGPDLNLLIEKKVMGWNKIRPRPEWWSCKASEFALENDKGELRCPVCQVHDYSGSIEYAWEVVDKMTEPPKDILSSTPARNTIFMLLFQKANLWACTAKEASLKICRAALLAVSYK